MLDELQLYFWLIVLLCPAFSPFPLKSLYYLIHGQRTEVENKPEGRSTKEWNSKDKSTSWHDSSLSESLNRDHTVVLNTADKLQTARRAVILQSSVYHPCEALQNKIFHCQYRNLTCQKSMSRNTFQVIEKTVMSYLLQVFFVLSLKVFFFIPAVCWSLLEQEQLATLFGLTVQKRAQVLLSYALVTKDKTFSSVFAKSNWMALNLLLWKLNFK